MALLRTDFLIVLAAQRLEPGKMEADMASMTAAQLAELNAIVAEELKAWRDAGDNRADPVIVDEILARAPSAARFLSVMRCRRQALRGGPALAAGGAVVKLKAWFT